MKLKPLETKESEVIEVVESGRLRRMMDFYDVLCIANPTSFDSEVIDRMCAQVIGKAGHLDVADILHFTKLTYGDDYILSSKFYTQLVQAAYNASYNDFSIYGYGKNVLFRGLVGKDEPLRASILDYVGDGFAKSATNCIISVSGDAGFGLCDLAKRCEITVNGRITGGSLRDSADCILRCDDIDFTNTIQNNKDWNDNYKSANSKVITKSKEVYENLKHWYWVQRVLEKR